MNIAAHIAFTNENKPWMDIFLAIYAGGVVEKKKVVNKHLIFFGIICFESWV